MALPQNFLDELIYRSDIVDTVSRYVQLRKTGSNHVGLCPFHNEKTPSFTVSRDKQFFKCFGCGEGGNVITFVMKMENLPFIDAVRLLAERCGMTVPEDDYDLQEYMGRLTVRNNPELQNTAMIKYTAKILNRIERNRQAITKDIPLRLVNVKLWARSEGAAEYGDTLRTYTQQLWRSVAPLNEGTDGR